MFKQERKKHYRRREKTFPAKRKVLASHSGWVESNRKKKAKGGGENKPGAGEFTLTVKNFTKKRRG